MLSYGRALVPLAVLVASCSSSSPPDILNPSAPGGSSGVANGTGTATATTAGTSSGTGAGIAPDCEQFVLTADRSTPDVLIVLDRSTSMIQNDSLTDRWSGSVNAINTIVEELGDVIRFGLMVFPGGDPIAILTDGGAFEDFTNELLSGENTPQCLPGTLEVPFSVMNAQAIRDSLGGMLPLGFTPTAQTLAKARQVLNEAPKQMVGEFPPAKYVLLVTDGDPNCFSDAQSGDTEAQQASIAEVQNLRNDGSLTYVIGFQTGGTSFAGVLDQMAAEGGTGDTAHRSVMSGDELLDEFRQIAGSSATCTFVLGQKVDVSRVDIRVDGTKAEYETDWVIRDDGQTIDLLGATCDALRTGGTVEADVSCEPVRVI